MDIPEPYHDDEVNGVLFKVDVLGRLAQGYISCALLAVLGGPANGPEAWVETYRRHRPLIDGVVSRRAPAEGWETVLVRLADLPPRADDGSS